MSVPKQDNISQAQRIQALYVNPRDGLY